MRKKLFLLRMRIGIWKVHWQENYRYKKFLNTLKEEYQEKILNNEIMLLSDLEGELKKKHIHLPLGDVKCIYRSLESTKGQKLNTIARDLRNKDLTSDGAIRLSNKTMYPDFEELFKKNYSVYFKEKKVWKVFCLNPPMGIFS